MDVDNKIRCCRNSSKAHFFIRDFENVLININMLCEVFREIYEKEEETPVEDRREQEIEIKSK